MLPPFREEAREGHDLNSRRKRVDIGLPTNRSRLNLGRLRKSRWGCRWKLKLLANEILGNEVEELISGRQYVKGEVAASFTGRFAANLHYKKRPAPEVKEQVKERIYV